MSGKIPYPNLQMIIRSFAPGWFASIMGTGMLAILCLSLSSHWSWLRGIAQTLHFLNLTLFLILLVPWILRWVLYPSMAWATIKHPVQANFYATFSIALLVLAAQGLAFNNDIGLVSVVWWSGTVLAYVFSFVILYHVFIDDTVTPEHINPAQFMPAVGLVVIPISGGPLLAHMQGPLKELALLLNVFGLGAGILLYLGLFALMVHKNYLHKPLFGMLTPTLWIQISPISIIPVSLMNLLPYLNIGSDFGFFKIFALLCLGAGLWWLIICIMITITAYRKKLLSYALTWWAFIFPLGALANLCLRISNEVGYSLIYHIGIFVIILMAILWLITLYKTLSAVLRGTIFST